MGLLPSSNANKKNVHSGKTIRLRLFKLRKGNAKKGKSVILYKLAFHKLEITQREWQKRANA